MDNKVIKKKYLIFILIISIIFIISFIFVNKYEYNMLRKEENNKINSIVVKVKEKYPDVTDDEIIEILNNTDSKDILFSKYGIYIDKESLINNNEKNYSKFLIINTILVSSLILSIIVIILLYERKKDKELKRIIECITKINKKDYRVDIKDNSEDELSILKNEIYKTTIMLKEDAENSIKDKKELKVALEDISHQLKTPLTSMSINIDNILDDPNMDNNIRQDFIKDIKRDIYNINFLVQNLLKLSKFDSNTITFNNDKYLIKDIIDESIKNVSPLIDLKNININIVGDNNIKILCDYKWQIEAISNIIKNCIEHSYENGTIDIKYNDYKLYTTIEIIDYGELIDKKDIKHIFERFYKAKNSKSDSIGIGLSLSKAIVEKNNGYITVKSDTNTRFIIKYFK